MMPASAASSRARLHLAAQFSSSSAFQLRMRQISVYYCAFALINAATGVFLSAHFLAGYFSPFS